MPLTNHRVLAARLSAAGLMLGLVATPWLSSEPALAQSSDSRPGPHAYQVTQVFAPLGVKTDQGYPLSKPDDIVRFRDTLFVAFQNGVGPMGETASNGNTESSLVELTPAGRLLGQWDLTGKIDGLGVDPAARTVVATVNEDGQSSLYTVDPEAGGSGVTHYCYDQNPLPHGGGTDSVAFYGGRLILSASAPSPAPAAVPAVYAVTLEPGVPPTNCPAGTTATGTAVLAGGFSDTSPATPANAGAPSVLALTDPDSSTVVPRSAPRFGGDFQLDSQGDDQQVYTPDPLGAKTVDVLQLSQSVNDTAFVTSGDGALYATDASANAVDRITGPFKPGQAYAAVTPCNDNNAPATCPAPGFPANYLGRLDLSNGSVSSVSTGLQPGGLIFVPNDGDR